LIQETMRKEFSKVTVLTIAHRINTILDSDRVMVLDAGKLVEFDSPKALLENKESLFYAMAAEAGVEDLEGENHSKKPKKSKKKSHKKKAMKNKSQKSMEAKKERGDSE